MQTQRIGPVRRARRKDSCAGFGDPTADALSLRFGAPDEAMSRR